jgi:eukaryotic-like serine/threonine-protein kinase
MLAPGAALGPYHIQELLGSGGMGEVYRAVDTRLGRTVAVKVLTADPSDDPQRRLRFAREAHTISSLNHPHICSLFDVGEHDGIDFLVMEYLSGETLAARLAKGALPIEQAFRIAIEIAEALDQAHRNGVIHRDLKPGNIMISNGRAKLLDFGLAKASLTLSPEADSDPSRLETAGGPLTVEGTVLGTLAYMSPEQLDGKEADASSDIFAFGAVLFEMLTGRPAFEGTSEARVMAAVLDSSLPAVTALRPDAPAAVDHLVHRCLAKHPDDRWQTIRDLLSELKWIASPSAMKERPAVSLATAGRGRRRWGLAATAAVLLLAGALGLWAWRIQPYDSIAILPLDNASGDYELQYLSDGITEGVIRALSPLPGTKVMSGISVLRYKGQAIDPQEVARTLKVATLLVGRMSERAGILTIDMELIDGRDSRQVWAERYTRPMTDVFKIEEDIAREVSDTLRVKLSGATAAQFAKRSTIDTEAYELYLRGRYYWNKRLPHDLMTSVGYFKQAIDKDPDYALAYAGLADAYNLLGTAGYEVQAPSDVIPKARAAAERALALDDQLAEAHAALGFVLRFEFDRSGAEREHLRAVALDPNYVPGRQWLASHLWTQGRFDEALVQLRRAYELDPLSPLISLNLGRHFYFAREYDRAIEHLRHTIALDPNGFMARQILALIYLEQGRPDAALAELQQVPAPMGAFQAVRGYVSAVTGDRVAALKVVAELQRLSRTRYIPAYALATVYTGLDMRDEAFDQLERAVAERSSWLDYLNAEPTLDRLRSDPRFHSLLQRVDLQEVPVTRTTARARATR